MVDVNVSSYDTTAVLVERLIKNDELVKCKSGDCNRLSDDLCSKCTAAVSTASWLEGNRRISAAAFVNRCAF